GLAGDYPRRAPVLLVHGDREAEVDPLVGMAHLAPGGRAVRAVEHAAVVLLPDVVGLALAADDHVRVVARPLVCGVGRVVHEEALVPGPPRLPAVARLEHARRRDADEEPAGIARVRHDRMDAGRE